MLRPIVLSNGELHVGINNYGLVHDFYYPYVGLANHSAGAQTRHRVGVWINGVVSWLDNDGEWIFEYSYPDRALVGSITAINSKLGVTLEFEDFVDSNIAAFMRRINVINNFTDSREIRLFLHQAFAIDDSRSNTDTGQYLPDSHALLHYRGRRAFIVAGTHDGEPFDQHSIGLFGIEGHEGTYKDAEDGELTNGSVEHGRVDSIMRFMLQVDGNGGRQCVDYWITAGSSLRDALFIDKQVRTEGFEARKQKTNEWWSDWLKPAVQSLSSMPEVFHDSFIKSVMIIKSQIDKRGAVIASTDTSMLNYDRDAYAYCWPRDGALVMWPFIRMGYFDEPYRFFEFCRKVLHPSGYLMHKFRADGGLGSSWHSYIHPGGIHAPPIQEDETALVVFMLGQFYAYNKDSRILNDFYDSMIKPMADWMTEFVEPNTGLPKPSYDLWEEIYLTTTFTTATTFAALKTASDLAEAKGDSKSAVKWRAAAVDIQAAAHKLLYNHDRATFYKGLQYVDGEIKYNTVIDTSAVFGAFTFGLFDLNSEELTNAVHSVNDTLRSDPNITAFPRYENDGYHRRHENTHGNWWFIPTLWMAQYSIERGDNEMARSILDWVKSLSMSTGALAEQIDPVSHDMIAPAPLSWSNAEYISTLLDISE